MRRYVGRGLGKLIVLGEHAVVYGHRALAASVSLGTTVTLSPREGPTALDGGAAGDERLRRALALALPPEGWRVTITSELPVGRGMGSSAALTVALLRAAAAARGERPSPAELHRRGFAIERIFHGTPSGLDHAVAAAGGAVIYRRGEAPIPAAMPPLEVVVLDSGVAGDTGALVAEVRARRPGIDPTLDRLGALAERGLEHLGDPRALGALMDEAQALLGAIGVSTPQLEALCQLAREAGALGAKLSGAGGGGVVLALAGQAGPAILRAARRRGIRAFRCTLPGR